ncbi:MAG: S41 family peptidase [Candidatus Adlerbacteria bacterium]|nr:S41 family peptidase [Candidatus Adlerbacteria bacterium]
MEDSLVPMDERCGPLLRQILITLRFAPTLQQEMNESLRENGCIFDRWSGIFQAKMPPQETQSSVPAEKVEVPSPHLRSPPVPLPNLRPIIGGKVKYYDGFAYLRISRFEGEFLVNFHEQVLELIRTPPTGIILDLRNNPGGFVQVAYNVLDLFAPWAGIRGITLKTRSEVKLDYAPKAMGPLAHIPIAVLVNGGSASCSEMVAGVLRLWYPESAVLVGSRTYGKGIMQEAQSTQWMFEAGIEVKVTSAYYFPGGDTKIRIHDVGLNPDVIGAFPDEEGGDIAVAVQALKMLPLSLALNQKIQTWYEESMSLINRAHSFNARPLTVPK